MKLTGFVVIGLFLASCQTMSDEQRSSFQCTEWRKGTKNIDQIRATYTFATGKNLIIRSGGPRTGVTYIDGDIEALKNEIDLACQ